MNQNDLRETVLQERMLLPRTEIQKKSKLIVQKVMGMVEWIQAGALLIYADFRHEVQTGELIIESLALGKQVTTPLIRIAKRQIIPTLIRDYPDDLQPGRWGIPEPKSHLSQPFPPELLDLVIVPGVVFDETGNRLGYGGGYFDRFLPRLKEKANLVALAFELQIRQGIAPEIHDVPVHYIVTEQRIICTKNKPSE